MSRVTPATRALDLARVEYTLHAYEYDPNAANIGMDAATALGIAPARMLKTLMVELDGRPACAILPVDHALSLKRLASALQGRHAVMLAAAAAERVTGYYVGGISPFGQKKRVPMAVELRALAHTTVYVNGGQRGLQLELDPHQIVCLLSATTSNIIAGE